MALHCARLPFVVVTLALPLSALSLSSAAQAQALVVTAGSPQTIGTDTTVDSLTIDPGAILTLNARLTVLGDATVRGTLTHSEESAAFRLDVAGTLAVPAGGLVSGSGLGLGGGNNGSAFGGQGEQLNPLSLIVEPGSGLFNGGSHGGTGGLRDGGQVNPSAPYDAQEGPLLFGGGGGAGACGGNFGGKGGGRLFISAGNLALDGQILADGQNGSGAGCPGGGGGAGGSIRIEIAGTFSGVGSVRAEGGDGTAGGGGGGRVSVTYAASTYTGGLSAVGGAAVPSGADGSVFVVDTTTNALVIQAGHARLDGADAFSSVTLLPSGNLVLAGPANITAPVIVDSGTRLTIEASDAFGALTVDPNIDGTIRTVTGIAFPSTLTFNGGASLIANDTVTINGDLILNAGSTVTHDVRTTDAALDVSGLMHIRAGAFLDVNGRGLPAGRGIDPQTLLEINMAAFQGGSHGGRGGSGGAVSPGSYDDPRNPTLPGSGGGGGACGGNFAGAGGGVFHITAGSLRVDGLLRADGTNGGGGCPGGGGGSGGSIRIDAGSLVGVGAISARGAGTDGGSGGGAGGRIAIFTTSPSAFTGQISALAAGSSGSGGGLANGGQSGAEDGSVHIEDATGALTAEGGVLALGFGDAFPSVTLRPFGTLSLVGPASVTAPVVVTAGATVRLEAVDSLSAASIDTTNVNGTIIVNAQSALPSTVNLNGRIVLNDTLSVTGGVTVRSGAVITHDIRETGARLEATGLVHIQTGGTVDLNAKGLPAGRTIDALTLLEVSVPSFVGGSHGGRGGNTGSAPYDDARAPSLPGSGGGGGACGGNFAGAGGGVLSLSADVLRVDGVIRADGTDGGGGCPGGGGGSGGALHFQVNRFEGTNGLVTARGGTTQAGAGGGGGGRIAIYYTTKTFSGVVSALASGVGASEPGSVFMSDAAGNLTSEGGVLALTFGDSFPSVTLRPAAIVSLDGPAQITSVVTIPLGTTLRLQSVDSLNAVQLNPVIGGTLIVNAETSLPISQTINGTLVLNSLLDVTGDLTVSSGGTITHDVRAVDAALDVSNRVRVSTGGIIDLNGKGLPAGRRIDPQTLLEVNVGAFVGGGHGGVGGNGGAGGINAASYDDLRVPVLPGSGGGGGACGGNFAGAGGGVLAITANILDVDGIIRADGTNGGGGCPGGGGGGGGSLRFTVSTFEGTNGQVTARGGTTDAGSGAGGGGRISILYTTKTFTGVVSATTPGLGGAGNGTVYMEDGVVDLVAEAGVLPLNADDSYNSITLRPGAVVVLDGPASISETVVIPAGTTMILNSADALDNVSIDPTVAGTLVVNAPTALPSTTTVNGSIVLNDRLSVAGDFIVAQGGLVTHDQRETGAFLDVDGLVHVRSGGTIDLNGKGLPVGRAIDPLTLLEVNVPSFVGGSHGGVGGNVGGNAQLQVYDDPRIPLMPGGGAGGGACGGNFAGGGGGVIRIDAFTLRLDGIIRADGGDGGGGCPGGGGGGGGSIRVDVQNFEGTGGLLTAKGGNTQAGSGAGGGGRVFVLHRGARTFNGVVSALTPGLGGAQAGTVHVEDPAGNLFVESGFVHLDEDDSYTSVTIGASGILSLEGPAIIDEPVSLPAGGRVVLDTANALDNVRLDPIIGGALEVRADTVIDDNVELTGSIVVERVLQLRSLEMLQGSLVTHVDGVFTMNLVVSEELAMRAGSRISADGLGFNGSPSSGFGARGATLDPLTLQVAPGSGSFNGGSHTTQGGLHDGNQPLAAVFDDPNNPVFGGGGGGGGNCGGNAGGDGGGVVRVAAGSLVLDGIISADGLPGVAGCTSGGGGAGGSVVLAVGSRSGSGAIFARGGGGTSGAGAGGVIKVTFASDTYGGVEVVTAGAGATAGAAGVVVEGVENTAPEIVSVPPADAQIGVTFRYRPFATGASPLTWALVEGPAGSAVNATTGEVTWTPAGGGLALFLIRVTNPLGNDEQAFELNPTGPPGITSTPTTNGFVGVPYQYDADGRAEAVGDAPIIWSTLVAPVGFTIASGSGAISWTPEENGDHGVCIAATNAAGDDIQCFTITVTPQGPPVFTSVPATLGEQFRAYLYDDDGAVSAVGPPPITFSAVDAPDGFDIDPSSGVVEWTPTEAGDFAIVLRAENALGIGEQAFTISVLPEGDSAAPVIVPSANPLAAVGVPYVYDDDGAASSGGASPITWDIVNGPAGLRVDAATGLVTWLPDAPGLVDVTLRASNAFGDDEYTFQIDVLSDPGAPPTPVADLDPIVGDAPLDVVADGSGSFASPGRSIAFYRWTWGDGSVPSSDAISEHRYEQPGSYVARLTVTEGIGTSAEASVVVRVSDNGVLPPAARILVSSVNGRDDLEVSFSCECDDGDAPITAFLWDFGDGTQSDLAVLSHNFGPGAFEVRLTVVDGNGLTATDTVSIRVSAGDNQPPIVLASASPTFGAAPLSTAFLATYGDVDGQIASVAWDFGEGGTAADAAPQYTYATPGTYLAQVTVTDDDGLTATSSIELDVANEDGTRPPQILSLPRLTGAVGKAYSYDEDGLPAARGDRPLTWSLGKIVGGETVGAPAGMRVDAATGAIVWTPTNENGAQVAVTLVAANGAAAVSQDWIVEVSGVTPPVEGGCGCDSSSSPVSSSSALGLGAAALVIALAGARRRRRQER